MAQIRAINGAIGLRRAVRLLLHDQSAQFLQVGWALKRGTVAKNIRLTSNQEEVECNVEKMRGLVLKTCFLKKA